ncbi:MAG TPA: TonB-dependent receptor [Rhodanobacteraceae bacterium]
MEHRKIALRTRLLAALITGTIAGTLALPGLSIAQSANSTLQGNAPPNAQITARNVATGQTRVTHANAQGRYTMVSLPPGTWQVRAGSGAPHTIALAVASTSVLNLATAAPKAAPGQTLATVQVTANALNMVNNDTSQVGQIVSPHQIQVLPQQSRNFLAFAQTVPGMIYTVNQNGTTSLQGGVQKTNAINVYIDGVSQKSDVMEGGVAGQFSTQGNPFPQDAIGSYRVITSNYKAEYGQVSSAVVTAVTKTGTNQFHGSVFMDYTNDNRRAETPGEKQIGKKTPSMSKEYGFSLGGPIVKDKAHFFISDSQKLFNTPITVDPASGFGPSVTSLLPASVQAQFGPASLPFFENQFFGDADWELSDRDRLVLRIQDRSESQLNNIGTGIAADAGIAVKNDARYYDLEYDHDGNNWHNKVLLMYQHAFYRPTGITSTGIGQAYTYGPQNNASIIQTGAASPLAFQDKGQAGPGFKDALTFTGLNWHGNHTIQVGVRYQALKLTALDATEAAAQEFFNVCPLDSTDPRCPAGTGSAPYQAQFAVAAAGTSPIARTDDKQYGFYAQDDWIVNQHLTFNLGVRWDEERNPSYLNWVTPASIVAAINSQYPGASPGLTYAQALARGGVNVDDFIANGHNRHANSGDWQPRLGFSYDINGDQRHVIFGGAGRSYDRNLYNLLQLEQTKIALAEPTVFFHSANQPCKGNPCVAWDPAKYDSIAGLQSLVSPVPGAGEVDMMSNNLKQPYSDQFSIGMRNKVGAWNTSATVVRVVSHRGLAAWLGDRAPDGAFFVDGNADFGNPIPGLGNLILWTNGIETRSTQILLYADKPYTDQSRWGMSIAYTHTNAYANRDITQHYSFDEPTIDDYPFLISNAAPKNRLVVTGSVGLPWGLMFSGILTLQTPTPFNTISCFVDGSARFGNGDHCTPAGGVPGGNGRFLIGGKMFAYRDVDLALIKNFRTVAGMNWYLRLDVLNAFNFTNPIDLNMTSDAEFTNTAATYNPTGNILGYPRTLKFTAGMRF